MPPFIPFVEILERSAKIVPYPAFREALGDAASEIAKIMPELRRIFPDISAPIELPADQQRRFLFNVYQEFHLAIEPGDAGRARPRRPRGTSASSRPTAHRTVSRSTAAGKPLVN